MTDDIKRLLESMTAIEKTLAILGERVGNLITNIDKNYVTHSAVMEIIDEKVDDKLARHEEISKQFRQLGKPMSAKVVVALITVGGGLVGTIITLIAV